jgi:hypothetical protein
LPDLAAWARDLRDDVDVFDDADAHSARGASARRLGPLPSQSAFVSVDGGPEVSETEAATAEAAAAAAAATAASALAAAAEPLAAADAPLG